MAELTKATAENLKRVDSSIENSFIRCKCCNNVLPSWIEISLIDFCNRRCAFCPRGIDIIAPNQKNLFMPVSFIEKIAKDISEINFQGTIMLAGYGEPMAAPSVMDSIKIFSKVCRIEMTTNGDLLTAKKIKQMLGNGIAYIIVSVYDGPDQIDKFKKIFKEAGVSKDKYTLRDRWYDEKKDFGIKLTNRAGLINTGIQPSVNNTAQCFYPHYSMTIDWNGDVFLCPQDWHRRIKCGNVALNSVHDVWMGTTYKKYRDLLFTGNRSVFPCFKCNCTGTLHGETHAKGWYDKRS